MSNTSTLDATRERVYALQAACMRCDQAIADLERQERDDLAHTEQLEIDQHAAAAALSDAHTVLAAVQEAAHTHDLPLVVKDHQAGVKCAEAALLNAEAAVLAWEVKAAPRQRERDARRALLNARRASIWAELGPLQDEWKRLEEAARSDAA